MSETYSLTLKRENIMHAKELQLAADQFNLLAPVGTKLRICKGPRGPHAKWINSEVIEPGAFVMGGHPVMVKVPGDSIAVGHVEIAESA